MFPFEFAPATIFYLFLYGATLVLHVLPMNYVLAGSTYLAAVGIWETVRGPALSQRPLVETLRDWMPFVLGVTITAAVAPLLFLQILYQRPFYTANLLLFHRWMAILPVLIVAFYLLYLQKSKGWHKFAAWIRAGISTGILACFAFVAWSWTENHLLSTRPLEVWTKVYASNDWFYRDPELMPRLAVWYVGAFPVLAAALLWQLWSVGLFGKCVPITIGDSSAPERPPMAATLQSLCLLAYAGLIGSVAVGLGYFLFLDATIRERLVSSRAWPYLAVAVVGLAGQAWLWRHVQKSGCVCGGTIASLAAAIGMAVSAATGLREMRRTATVDLAAYLAQHTEASKIGGVGTFLVFAVITFSGITAVVIAVRRGLAAGKSQA
ncbi:MAG: hypothetical protein QM775_21590 [Pirellulales bacterium]